MIAKKILIFLILIFISTVPEGCKNKTNTSSLSKNKSTNQAQVKDKANKITLIDLGSTKCYACKMMEPVIEKLKKNFNGKINVVFYDVWTEEGKPYAYKYQIRVIPTQIILDKNGNEVFRHEGYLPYDFIVAKLKELGVSQ